MLTIQSTATPPPVLAPANDGNFAKPVKVTRFINVHYRLQNGSEGDLAVMQRSTSDAILHVLDLFGDQVRKVSARPL